MIGETSFDEAGIPPDPATSRAVLIGVSTYEYLDDLPSVANNLLGLQDLLTSSSGWALPAEHCITISNPKNSSDVVTALREASVQSRDTLLVYYAGHGVLDDELRFYVSLSGSAADEPWACLSYEWIRKTLGQSLARRRVAILDSCFSGKVHRGSLSQASDAVRVQTAAAGTIVLTSARDDRVALAPPGERYTAFTGELLTVLTDGIPGGSSVITVDHAYELVKQRLVAKGRPRPDRTGSDTAGQLVLARNVAFAPPNDDVEVAAFPETIKRLAHRIAIGEENAKGRPDDGAPPLVHVLNGRYEVTGLLGQGGMGSVYQARDKVLGRTVSIKATRAEVDGHANWSLWAHNEAWAGAKLNHPSIAAVYDFWENDGAGYIVMERLTGCTLTEMMNQFTLTRAECIAIAYEMLSALEYSHDVGVIHCDVKPQNVMVTTEGRLKVLDFGLAQTVDSPRGSIYDESGYLIGTLAYIPPEGVNGEPPDIRRDVYGAGVTLFQLLTGQLPFSGTSAYQVLAHKVNKDAPSILSLVPDLGSDLDAVVACALARNPNDRFQCAAEMKRALSACR